jgi:hypothetical protein
MAELCAQIAAVTLEKAEYAGRASCTRRKASCKSCHVSCNTHLPHDAVRISIWHAAHRQRSCQQALLVWTGGESATCTCHAAMRWKTGTTRAQLRYAAQYSNLAVANSELAAQCGASMNATATSDGSLRDGSGSQCTLACTRLSRTHVRVRWMCQREPHNTLCEHQQYRCGRLVPDVRRTGSMRASKIPHSGTHSTP